MPVTARSVLPLRLPVVRREPIIREPVAVYARGCTMDATYFRDKAETCLRLAKGLSWNNPARGELMELAEEFQRQAEELKATTQRSPAR